MKAKIFFLFFIVGLFSMGGFSIKAQTSFTSTTHSKAKKGIVIYPNPVHSTATFEVTDKDTEIKSITIYSIIGKQVADYKRLNSERVTLQLSRLRSGKYLVKYALDNRTVKVAQLIKQ